MKIEKEHRKEICIWVRGIVKEGKQYGLRDSTQIIRCDLDVTNRRSFVSGPNPARVFQTFSSARAFNASTVGSAPPIYEWDFSYAVIHEDLTPSFY